MSKRAYEMTQEQLGELLEAMQPVPLIMLQCGVPRTPTERATGAWVKLGEEMGFDGRTAEPMPGKGMRFFIAEEISKEN